MMVSDYITYSGNHREIDSVREKSIQNARNTKKPRKQQIMSVSEAFFISATSDAPVEDTDIPEDLYPDPP